jgi:alpha-D-xyloside xylohydrolase
MPLMPEFTGYDPVAAIGARRKIPGGVTLDATTRAGHTIPISVALMGGYARVRLGDPAKGAPIDGVPLARNLKPDAVKIAETDAAVTITGRALKITLSRQRFALAVARRSGAVLWTSSLDDMDQKGRERVLPLGVEGEARLTAAFQVEQNEHFYGLGEKFSRVDKYGLSIVSANSNAGGATSEKAYKNIPFFISSRGYGVFFNTSVHMRHEVANPTLSILSYVVITEAPALEFWVIDGPEPKTILKRYGALTGFPERMPPAWGFGVIMSRFYYQNWEVIDEAVAGMRKRGIPLDIINTDTYWMHPDRLSDLEWDETRFPEPARRIAALREQGVKVMVWIYPYLSEDAPAWKHAWAQGWLVRRADGSPCNVQTTLPVSTHHLPGFRGVGTLMSVYHQPLVKPGTLIDFTHPGAVAWYRGLVERGKREGIAVYKCDFGEDVPADAVFHNGRSGREMHNIYPVLYQQVVADAMGEGHMNWSRSGWAGVQRFPVHWSGDPVCTWSALASTIRSGLSWAMSGVPFWSHDIGGFAGTPSPSVYIRWTQFGMLSPFVRAHGTTPREPWEFGAAAVRNFKNYGLLRMRLLPYLWTTGVAAKEDLAPMLRPMVLEFPDDPTTRTLDLQYLLGRDLLVAPVLNDAGDCEIYLPAGAWFDWWSGARIAGPCWVKRKAKLDEQPMYLRADAVVPLGPEMQHADEKQLDEIELVLAPVAGGVRRLHLPDGDRLDVSVSLSGATVALSLKGRPRRYRVRLYGGKVMRCAGGGARLERDGAVSCTLPKSGQARISLTLRPAR